jgi:hypothetical protein
LRQRIADGDVSAGEIILAPPGEARSWSVLELLISQRQWGRAKARKFLLLNQIDELKPIGKLTDRQRRLLAPQLAPGAPRETSGVGKARIADPRVGDVDTMNG